MVVVDKDNNLLVLAVGIPAGVRSLVAVDTLEVGRFVEEHRASPAADTVADGIEAAVADIDMLDAVVDTGIEDAVVDSAVVEVVNMVRPAQLPIPAVLPVDGKAAEWVAVDKVVGERVAVEVPAE